jgi:dihydropteroate synthase
MPPPKTSFSIKIGRGLCQFSGPAIMGILNLSPDSFYEKSRMVNETLLIKKAESMLADGANFLDLGAVSSRPGAKPLSQKEEWARLGPALQKLRKNFPDAILSVDTYSAAIAEKAINEGADIINDISGGNFDSAMFETVAKMDKPLIIMHIKGDFTSMHQPWEYDNIAVEVCLDIQKKIRLARQAGIKDIIADPGFGFSKKGKQNFELLARLAHLQSMEVPILVGISRKSMIYKTLEIDPEEALNGTTALHMAALMGGASILRVHDVKETRQTVRLFENLCSQE